MQQPKLKIGDRVKVINKESGIFGKYGVILLKSDIRDWFVDFGEHNGSLNESELQLITHKQKSKWKNNRKEVLQKLGFLFKDNGEYLSPCEIDGDELYKLMMAKQSPDKEEHTEDNLIKSYNVKQPIKSKEIEEFDVLFHYSPLYHELNARQSKEFRKWVKEITEEVNKLKENK